jgi:hypothetical protein
MGWLIGGQAVLFAGISVLLWRNDLLACRVREMDKRMAALLEEHHLMTLRALQVRAAGEASSNLYRLKNSEVVKPDEVAPARL